MTVIEQIQEIIGRLQCEVRLKVKSEDVPSPWSKWISEPTNGYVETFSAGPWPKYEIEWIDINPIAIIHIGRLVKDKHIDKKAEVEESLIAAGIPFFFVMNNYRIYL